LNAAILVTNTVITINTIDNFVTDPNIPADMAELVKTILSFKVPHVNNIKLPFTGLIAPENMLNGDQVTKFMNLMQDISLHAFKHQEIIATITSENQQIRPRFEFALDEYPAFTENIHSLLDYLSKSCKLRGCDVSSLMWDRARFAMNNQEIQTLEQYEFGERLAKETMNIIEKDRLFLEEIDQKRKIAKKSIQSAEIVNMDLDIQTDIETGYTEFITGEDLSNQLASWYVNQESIRILNKNAYMMKNLENSLIFGLQLSGIFINLSINELTQSQFSSLGIENPVIALAFGQSSADQMYLNPLTTRLRTDFLNTHSHHNVFEVFEERFIGTRPILEQWLVNQMDLNGFLSNLQHQYSLSSNDIGATLYQIGNLGLGNPHQNVYEPSQTSNLLTLMAVVKNNIQHVQNFDPQVINTFLQTAQSRQNI
jgi:hypothetical protein